MSDNMVTFGLKSVKYALATVGTSSITYGAVKSLRGAQELTVDLLGSQNRFYADDIIVGTFNAIAGKTMTLTLTEVPDEFKIDCLGYVFDENNNLVECTNKTKPQTFAIGFEMNGDVHRRRTWYFLATAAPINEGTKSITDSVEANAVTVNITCYAFTKNEYELMKLVARTGDDNYETFLDNPPSLDFNYTVSYEWNPTKGLNEENIATAAGVNSSIKSYTLNGEVFTFGYKLNTAQNLILNIPTCNVNKVTIHAFGYTNLDAEAGTIEMYDNTSRRSYVPTGTYNNRTVKEIKELSYTGAFRLHQFILRHYDYLEVMLCKVIVDLTFNPFNS